MCGILEAFVLLQLDSKLVLVLLCVCQYSVGGLSNGALVTRYSDIADTDLIVFFFNGFILQLYLSTTVQYHKVTLLDNRCRYFSCTEIVLECDVYYTGEMLFHTLSAVLKCGISK